MTEHKITPFLFEGEVPVRVIDKGGMLWFVAADVYCASELSNASETVRSLDDDEKGISTTDTLMGNHEVIVISESGLYALIFKSRKPRALRFRKWVTSKVLPMIRRTGAYIQPNAILMNRPYAEWSFEEKRIKLATVNTGNRTFNRAFGAWLWGHEGFPMPPPHSVTGLVAG